MYEIGKRILNVSSKFPWSSVNFKGWVFLALTTFNDSNNVTLKVRKFQKDIVAETKKNKGAI